MAKILRKFLSEIIYYEILKIKNGVQINEEKTERKLQGAIFPLKGKERLLELQGIIKKGTLKLYTNTRIDVSTDIHVMYQGIEYNLSSIKGDFPSDTLNTYYLEVIA